MVASASVDPYSPFHPHSMPAEDGPQSSEEGSGLHSPVSFGAPYATHGDSLRYSDGQHALGAQFDFSHSLAQQPPILSGALLDSSSRHVTYPAHYAMPPRNQLGVDFSVQPPVAHRIPAVPQHSPHIDFRYPPASERRLPGGPSQDPYNRLPGSSSALPMDSDHRSSLVPSSSVRSDASPAAETSTSPRDARKEISSVVIACRQCRSRKIRCDSTRPVCNNCVRRSNTCEYDTVPKRRGPDKRPGTRQRSCKKRTADGSVPPPPKRRRTTNTTERPAEQRELPPSKVKENLQHEPRRLSPTTQRHPDRHPHQQDHHYSHTSSQPPPPHTDLRMPSDQDNYKHDMSASYRRPPSYIHAPSKSNPDITYN
ncbi:hypothetical protein HYPSUDRAFT_586431 [Hypholoma sublateritium FD-334 SS-4]|uniref:Zn(2)-C6 fungal-type domain-containing protein n=1 Tax=Hypholoma sublateritium (strain FD-334 SS-4) TaxID=945553 RepID=A0A0D2MIB4_HYPSF|nr:hypothetical protein HYPSUDRAFT_586431 [Hypholoma sublateritium FD-334 SS-4]